MNKYGCIIRRVDDDGVSRGRWSWSGFAKGHNPLDAAKHLAISCEGYYEEDYDSDTELVEEFIEDGYRFKLMKVESVIENHEL